MWNKDEMIEESIEREKQVKNREFKNSGLEEDTGGINGDRRRLDWGW